MQNASPLTPWQTRESRAPLQLTLHWHGETLKLGEHIVLADGTFDAERVGALFTAAFGNAIALRALPYVKRAIETKREGSTTLALTHLALAGLPRLADPEAAAGRLLAADGLIKKRVAPSVIVAALTADPKVERAYDPDQPRVPAGNGVISGQWTSGDYGGGTDGAPAPSQSDGATEPAGVQIASDSDDWAQYFNPVGSAEAAGANWRASRGSAPNKRHDLGVERAVAKFRANGYDILTAKATTVIVPGFTTPRVVDFLARNSTSGQVVGGEVKTTILDTIFLNPQQVDKDVAIYETQAAIAPNISFGGRPVDVNTMSSIAYCILCAAIDFRTYALAERLKKANIQIYEQFLDSNDTP